MKANTAPLVTIIAVCYNQQNWVQQTLDSIKAQTYDNIQLIIADDGSSDDSKKIIQSWIDYNGGDVFFISHIKNRGLTRNINSAIPHIRGKYYQVFGCDDIMLPDKIKLQVAFLEQDESVGIVYSDMQLINSDGVMLENSYYQKHTYKQPLSGWIYGDMLNRIIISAPSVLIRMEVLNQLKKYNESLDYEDYDFFLRASKKYKFFYDPSITVKYRITGNSLSTVEHSDKYFKNLFIIFYQNFDKTVEFRDQFSKRLLFALKNLHSIKYNKVFIWGVKAFVKTGRLIFLKWGIAGMPYMITGKTV
ncbi:glycosyltransferase [Foetidibacter luteolus]|uniref:glycosyltransferase n=1 Tax=Foetidibacter luteolus TaxID=2608880 RepID=UPI00129A23CF|nr:glycosyltransferase [Foetidibacter luteolus]